MTTDTCFNCRVSSQLSFGWNVLLPSHKMFHFPSPDRPNVLLKQQHKKWFCFIACSYFRVLPIKFNTPQIHLTVTLHLYQYTIVYNDDFKRLSEWEWLYAKWQSPPWYNQGSLVCVNTSFVRFLFYFLFITLTGRSNDSLYEREVEGKKFFVLMPSLIINCY